MKSFFSVIVSLFFIFLPSRSQQHPCMYVSSCDKTTIQDKIRQNKWAESSFTQLLQRIDKYVNLHVTDSEWIVSRLAMYWKRGERFTQCYLKDQNWDRGEGDAPVPTVRMPGMRTWNKYINVPLENRVPYNETGDMWGIDKLNPASSVVKVPYKESGHMIRNNNVEILTLAENAAFAYWVTGLEKYARFAADIYNTWLLGTYYMNPILDPEQSCGSEGGWAPGGICGYYDYEQIHDDLAMHAAVIYDFLFEYLQQNPHPHLAVLNKSTKEISEDVFKRFIELGLIRGDKKGNWNVNGWNMILRPILVLDSNSAFPDGKGREYYLKFLIQESTVYHSAIPDMVKNYDSVTGLWPESPGYAFSTIQMILEWAIVLKRFGVDIISDNPILLKAAMAIFPWMDSQNNLVVFGDSRGGSIDFRMFEHLLTYYNWTNNKIGMIKVGNALRKVVTLGKYNRGNAGWMGICTHVPMFSSPNDKVRNERVSYSPHHRFIVMKNWNNATKLMAVLYGGKKGYHLSPNGLALQFYGFNYALAPDAAAYESYWSKDYNYHQSVLGSNTIVPGYSHGSIRITAMEPMVNENDFATSKALTPYLNFAEVQAAEKKRLVALMSLPNNAGYYIDVFRSNQDDNDYIFHNVGDSLELTNHANQSLSLRQVDDFKILSSDVNWFTDCFECSTEGVFKADWRLPQGITSRLWMPDNKGRKIFKMFGPSSTLVDGLTPDNCGLTPKQTPVLVVRQLQNNASKNPFVAVYESFKEEPSVLGVRLMDSNDNSTGLEVSIIGDRKDYYISPFDSKKANLVENVLCKGTFAQISEVGHEIVSLYLGNGSLLVINDCKIESLENKCIYVAVYSNNNKLYYSSTGKAKLTWRGQDYDVHEGYNVCLEKY